VTGDACFDGLAMDLESQRSAAEDGRGISDLRISDFRGKDEMNGDFKSQNLRCKRSINTIPQP